MPRYLNPVLAILKGIVDGDMATANWLIGKDTSQQTFFFFKKCILLFSKDALN